MKVDSPLAPAFGQHQHASYDVRVRGAKTYLWGSAGITVDATFDKPLLLYIRNNVFGQSVDLHTQSTTGVSALGSLQPGEAFTIAVQSMTGVYAVCAGESLVSCLLQDSK